MKNHKGMVAKLAELTDIDAIIAGHDHQLHPSGTDPLLTTNNGNNNFESDAIAHKPIVQPGCFGQCLGVIDLELGTKDGKISLISAQSQLLFPNAQNDEQETDIQNLPSLQKMHNDLLAQNAQKIAETNTALITYFEGALDSCALGLITKSQHEGATSLVKGTQFEGLPIVTSKGRIWGGCFEIHTYPTWADFQTRPFKPVPISRQTAWNCHYEIGIN